MSSKNRRNSDPDDDSSVAILSRDELLEQEKHDNEDFSSLNGSSQGSSNKSSITWSKRIKKYLLCLPDNDGWENPDAIPPQEGRPNSDKISPEASASVLNGLFFVWFNEMMDLGYQKPLMESDLHQLAREHDAEVVTDRLETEWREELRRQNENVQYSPSLGKAFVRTYWREYLAGVIPRLVKVLGSFVAPFLLQRLIQFVEDPSLSTLYGFSNLVASVGLHRYWHVTVKTAMHVRASCIGIIYRKALRLGTIAKQSSSTGEVVNLMSNDSQRLQDTAFYLHFLWATPVLIILCFFLAAQVIGYIPTLAGYGVFIVMTPFSFLIARSLEKIRQTGLKVTDKRVKSTNEIFNAIKTVKLYALEKVFFSRADATRNEEIHIVRRYQLIKALNTCLNNALVPLISTVAFVVFVLRGGELTASVAFSTISLFNMLKWPFALFKDITTGLVEARVSLERLQSFLHSEEVPKRYVFPSTASQDIQGLGSEKDSNVIDMDFQVHDPHISIRNGEFNWITDGPIEQSTLSGVNLDVSKGQLVCIVGPVGSGKSSLLNCILGEISKIGGTVEVDGRICYAPQVPFLQHASVRDNIIFGKEFDADFYDRVIDACGIAPDLDALLAGDQTLIGERGINLSGGQKARIGLARAVYADGDIYLLDDPLSAVDVHVGNKLFRDCIMKMLRAKGKIVLLVTHQLQYLVHADRILLLEDGKISKQGSYESLKQSGLDFAELLKKFNIEEQQISLEDSGEINAPSANHLELSSPAPKSSEKQSRHQSAAKNKNADLQANKDQEEERQLGGISKKVYFAYFLRQPLWWIIAGIAVFIYRALDLAQNFWVAQWSSAVSGTSSGNSTAPLTPAEAVATLTLESPIASPIDSPMSSSGHETRYYLTVYIILTLVGSVAMLAQEALIAFAGLRSGRVLYDRMVRTLLRAKMEFFDVTPKGRIMARVSHDTDQVDNAIAGLISTFANTVLQMIGTLVVIFASTTWFLIALVPLVIVYARIYLLFISSFRETARLQSLSKAPIFSVFSETLNGLFTIRAFKAESRFQHEIEQRININQRPYLYGFTTNRWLGMRMDFISGLITQTLATVAIFGRGSVSAPLIGVAITYSLLSNEFLNGLIRSMSDLEGKMNNVERMDQYSQLETEPPAILRTHRPPSYWPSQGAIEFENVKMRYRDGLPLVLNGLSFSIKPREKIGIVGRTGAGKSTLTTALFRLANLTEGRILIDGIDIASIGVKDLRSKLAIIPQDPVIFDGSIRRNLDPSETASDDDLWSVLQRVHLKDAVQDLGGLDASLAEEGSNMSAGQRQLLCIGRALLRKTKILLLDEASSSIDMETDYLLQQTIRREFADCTVLTIAHRLQTILDSDRILVMSQGQALEFDTPTSLLSRDSVFASMHSQAIRMD